jgi:hypothetical protein
MSKAVDLNDCEPWGASIRRTSSTLLQDIRKRPNSISHKVCHGCGEIIEGEYTEAMGKAYHREHFCCSHCNTSIENTQFAVVNTKVYCQDDYAILFLEKCFGCGLGMTQIYFSAFYL